jgi:hypothetical protein
MTSQSRSRLQDEVARLTALVDEMKGRLERLEGRRQEPPPRPSPASGGGRNGSQDAQSRRDLLKLAGAAAVGAAGAVVLRTAPAAAATGDPILMGHDNTTGATTNIFPGAVTGTPPSPILQALGLGATPPTVPANLPNQSIPLIGAIGAGGSLPVVGSAPADYPGWAPIQGVGGVGVITVNGVNQTVSEGINGWGKGKTGIGITGESDLGYGVVGGSGGIDLAALGNGRILQLALPVDPPSLLSNPPAGPPNYVPNDFEQVRDGNGVIWVSHQAPAGSPFAAYWRRLNTMIPITPARVVDTRSGLGGVNGIQSVGSTQTWALVGVNGIPANAVGLVGNLTAAGYSASGYLAIFPGGTAWPGNSTVNFSPASSAWANFFVVLFGARGDVSVYMGATSHVILDVAGYVQ